MKPKLLFVVNVDWFFMSHRLAIAREALAHGYEVHLAAAMTDRRQQLEALGLIIHPLNMDRSSVSLRSTLATLRQLFLLFRSVRPDLIHLVTIKPLVFGGIAARLSRVRHGRVAAISGLGHVFTAENGWARIRRAIVGWLYRSALGGKNVKVIFQNPDDRDTLQQFVRLEDNKIELIRGSGIDLDQYFLCDLPEGVPVVLFAGRLLIEKGVREFVEAARLGHERGVSARYCLAGTPDPGNPASLTEGDIERWVAEGCVEYWGHQDDMPGALAKAVLVVLPSYREGMPKVLLEAAACGRAVVATDVPGCRHAIIPEKTGKLVPVRDGRILGEAILALLEDRARCLSMGLAGRKLAEEAFDIRQVVAKHLEIYKGLRNTAS